MSIEIRDLGWLGVASTLLGIASLPGQSAAPSAAGSPAALDFHTQVLPILARHCHSCHGPDLERVKGGLRLDRREPLLRSGELGAVLVPGDPDASLLIQAVRYDDPDLRMPPDGPLPPQDRRLLEQWVREGAAWPAIEAAGVPRRGGIDIEAGRTWWAYRPLSHVEPPSLAAGAGVANAAEPVARNEIDAFVFARLFEAGLRPAPEAERRDLARRLWLDLLGLPPTRDEIDAFVADTAPDAYERCVERLLARPEYGERLARHWLDVVRYASTNGYERDGAKPEVWRYRDWVVDALNRDLPYDRFVLEQLAGDELEDADRHTRAASGFWRLGAWDDEPNDPALARYDELDDQLRTVSEGFLASTLGCARCHDHKFDPFPQADYYRMLAFLRGLRPYARPVFAPDSATLRLADDSPRLRERWSAARRDHADRAAAARAILSARAQVVASDAARAALSPSERALLDLPREHLDADQQAQVQELAARLDPSPGQAVEALGPAAQRLWFFLKLASEGKDGSYRGAFDWVLCATESDEPPEPVHVLDRGRPDAPLEEVEARFPAALCASDDATLPTLPRSAAAPASSGRRTALARWIASADNPLTARVIVNRVWAWHFGRGLVATPNDFGSTGAPPAHPELLDWLARRFIDEGWSLKKLHTLIVTSSTWRMTTDVTQEDVERAALVDPDNELLWRRPLRRLDAEVLWDSLLTCSGLLERDVGGPSDFPPVPKEALADMSRPGEGWGKCPAGPGRRRALYATSKRSLPVPLLAAFDGPTSAAMPIGERGATTVATQALALLNGSLPARAARACAERAVREGGSDPAARVRRAFELVLGRAPEDEECDLARTLFERALADQAARPQTSLHFAPALPRRVSIQYLRELSGTDVLDGPRRGWTTSRGIWGGEYNATAEADRDDGPSAWTRVAFPANFQLACDVEFGPGCTLAALLMRVGGARARPPEVTAGLDAELVREFEHSPYAGVPDDAAFGRGVELRFEPEQGRLSILGRAPQASLLASADCAGVAPGRHAMRIELEGADLRVWIDGARTPALQADVGAWGGAGRLGVRTLGGTFALHEPNLAVRDTVIDLAQLGRAPESVAREAELDALAALCLVLFNTDEFTHEP